MPVQASAPVFLCSVCGKEFLKEKPAEDCEKQHAYEARLADLVAQRDELMKTLLPVLNELQSLCRHPNKRVTSSSEEMGEGDIRYTRVNYHCPFCDKRWSNN